MVNIKIIKQYILFWQGVHILKALKKICFLLIFFHLVNCSWLNPTPQSYRFCRPIRIVFEKETEEAIINEYNRLKSEIESLVSHNFVMSNKKKAKVKFIISTTMFDGKCVNAIVGNASTIRCPMCLESSHSFNNFQKEFTANESSLKLGIGLLHVQIKTFEHLLQLSYKQSVKSWNITKAQKGITILF